MSSESNTNLISDINSIASNVTDLTGFCCNAKNLVTIDLISSNFNQKQNIIIDSLFKNCTNLTTVNYFINQGNFIYSTNIFEGCTNLTDNKFIETSYIYFDIPTEEQFVSENTRLSLEIHFSNDNNFLENIKRFTLNDCQIFNPAERYLA